MSIAKLAWVSGAVALFAAAVALARDDQDATVHITEKGYVPEQIAIGVGDKVVFRNISQKDHTVISKSAAGAAAQEKDKPGFDSGVIEPATSWEHKFTKEGTYTYYCKEDKLMTGTIVVISAK